MCLWSRFKITLWPIQIHVWGGFGSQLNALLLYWFIRDLYPNRSIELIFHSSGVTRREPEILSFLSINDVYRFVDDFRFEQSTEVSQKKKSTILLQTILQFLRLVIFSHKELPSYIRPWTFQLRGSYSEFCFPEELFNQLSIKMRHIPHKSFNCISSAHYRAGDLVSKKQDSLINPNVFFKQLLDLAIPSESYLEIDVFTDSLDLMNNILETHSLLFSPRPVFRIHALEIDSLSVLLNCLDSKVFVGSSSKISLWIALLRANERKSHTRLPKSMENIFLSMSPKSFWQFVDFY